MTIQSVNTAVQPTKIQNLNQNVKDDFKVQESNGIDVKSWLVGSLIGLGVVGTYCVIKKRKNTSSTQEVKQTVEKFKEMTFDAFKKDGCKFEKGKAKLSNGDNFTGVIKKTGSDNAILTLEYKNGILQKSNKIKDGKTIFEKTYAHNVSGDLRNVTNNDGKSLSISVDDKIKTIKTTGDNKITYDMNKKKMISSQKKGSPKQEYYYRDNNSKTLKYIKQDNKITKFDKDGKTILFTATEDEAKGFDSLIKDLIDKYHLTSMKDFKTYFKNKLARMGGAKGSSAPATPTEPVSKDKDYIDKAKIIWNKLQIKKAFEETKGDHFI